MELTEDVVLEILNLIERSHFDYFRLQSAELNLTVSKGGYIPPNSRAAPAPPPPVPAAAVSSPAPLAPTPLPAAPPGSYRSSSSRRA